MSGKSSGVARSVQRQPFTPSRNARMGDADERGASHLRSNDAVRDGMYVGDGPAAGSKNHAPRPHSLNQPEIGPHRAQRSRR